MTIATTSNQKDFKNFYKSYYLTKNLTAKKIFAVIFCSFLISLFIGDINIEGVLIFLVKYVGIGLLFYFTYLLIPYFMSSNIHKSIIGNGIITLDESGIKFEFNDEIVLRKWHSIKSSDKVNDYLFIMLYDNTTYLIPTKSFPSTNDELNFISTIHSEIIKVRGQLAVPRSAKPPYLVGLIGLIPIIGAFVGLVLIMFGIFQYKDKWLVIIGSAGILFSVILYSTLFYEMKNNDTVHSGFSKLSQIQLNSLVKEIEFYKLQNGNYPANLEEIKSDAFSGITDPIQLNQGRKDNINYYYEKINNRYKLFSLGFDGLANTNDDIHPTLTSDTSKIGLITN